MNWKGFFLYLKMLRGAKKPVLAVVGTKGSREALTLCRCEDTWSYMNEDTLRGEKQSMSAGLLVKTRFPPEQRVGAGVECPGTWGGRELPHS